MQHIANGINNGVRRIEPVVDYEHGNDPAKGRVAAGWVKQAEVRNSGLWLGVEFTDTGRKDVKAKNYRYISAELDRAWKDEDGKNHGEVLVAATLTNRPYMKSLEEFSLVASDDFITELREPGLTSEPTYESDLDAKLNAILFGDPNYFDVGFVQDMIRNHVNAIQSAADVLRSGNDDSVKSIAKATIREERAALDKVLDWIVAWDGTKQRPAVSSIY